VWSRDQFPCHELNPGGPAHSIITVLTEVLQFAINYGISESVSQVYKYFSKLLQFCPSSFSLLKVFNRFKGNLVLGFHTKNC
jgi:hypothetical protein